MPHPSHPPWLHHSDNIWHRTVIQITMCTHALSHFCTHTGKHQIGSIHMHVWVSRHPQYIVLKQYIYLSLYCSNIFPHIHPYFQPTQSTEPRISVCPGKNTQQNVKKKIRIFGDSSTFIDVYTLYIYTRVGTLIVATIYLQLIQNRYIFRSFTVLQCSQQHCVQPVASDVEVVGYL